MKCDEALEAYLDQSEQEGGFISLEVEQHITHCASCRSKINEMKWLLTAMQRQPKPEPPAELQSNFDEFLRSRMMHDSKSAVVRKLSKQLWLAASLVILVGLAILFVMLTQGDNSRVEGQAQLEKEDSIKAFASNSASVRIQAINQSDVQQHDAKLVSVLSNILLNDRNANVRMAALYSLADQMNNPSVYKLFIDALKKEQEPVLQVLLITTIAKQKNPRTVEAIQSLINNAATRKEVRSVAEQTIKTL